MKRTSLDNPEIILKDERITTLDRIVQEVKESEEWEAVQMNILNIGIEKGIEKGEESLATLYTTLKNQGRNKEAEEIMSNQELRKRLYQELGIGTNEFHAKESR